MKQKYICCHGFGVKTKISEMGISKPGQIKLKQLVWLDTSRGKR